MSAGTITSIYQMRKRRNDGTEADVVSAKSKSPRSVQGNSLEKSKSANINTPNISRTPSSHRPRSRQSVKDTSVRFLCSQSDSQTEISWDCNSPEYASNRKPSLRSKGTDSKDNVLNLVHDVFNITQGKVETKNAGNNLLSFWMAPAEVKVSQTLPSKTHLASTSGLKPPPARLQVGLELEQLVSKVQLNKAQLIDKGTSSKAETPCSTVRIPKSAKEIKQSEIERKTTAKDLPSNLKKDQTNFPKDVWEDEDLFNDDEFLAQTQKIMDDHALLNSSQATTQRIVSEDPDDSNEETTFENTFHFTAIKDKMAEVTAGSSKETEKKSFCPEKRNGIDLEDFWNCDDGFDEVMSTLVVPECEQDSLELLMNCSTQPYPSPASSPVPNEDTTQQPQTLDQTEKSTSPWVFDSSPGIRNPVVPSANNKASKSNPAQSQRYTAEQIEKKRQEALELRRQKLAQKTLPTRCQEIRKFPKQ